MRLGQGGSRLLRSIGLLVLFVISILCRSSFAAESPLPQAIAVYGAISTDPILWTAQEKGEIGI